MKKEIVAIIPARGGSKGIPRKNIKLIAGKPLLGYSIEHAKQTSAITRIIVSTDDAEISKVAQNFAAEVILRPAEISGDQATSESALLHVLNLLRTTEGYEPDLVVFLQATSPMRQPDDIQKAIETLESQNADSLFSACSIHGFVWGHTNGALNSISYDYQNRQRRQELTTEALEENGSIYLFKPWVLHQNNNRLGGKIAVHVMSALDSFQIDEHKDLQLVEQLFFTRQRISFPCELGRVRLLVLDFDGVMTDNRALVDQDGREAVWVSRSDGLGVANLRKAGVEVVVLSTEINPVVKARCDKLNIAFRQALQEKSDVLVQIIKDRDLQPEQVAYVGNDLNDLSCLQRVGVPIAVQDAYPEVKQAACIILSRPGGYGAVREICDLILESLKSKEELGLEQHTNR